MSLLDRLTSLVNFDFSKLKKFSIHILSNNSTQIYKVVDKSVHININALDPKGRDELKDIINGKVLTEGEILLRDDTKKTLEEFGAEDKKTENQEVVDFFKGKIPAKDLEALRASLFISHKFKNGEDVWELKKDIINTYGERGKNISNLCTAGYFTSQIKPLYEEMFSQQDFSPEKFNELYDVIVTESPYAIFIYKNMSEEEAQEEVLKRIAISKKYGIKYLNIHGIGIENVEKITKIIKFLESKFTDVPSISRSGNSVIVKINF